MTKRTRILQDQNQWQAQRDERMSTLMQQLEAGVEAIQTSEDFQRYLRTAATFHHYSPNNVLLILAQKSEATRVAGYKTWQSLGRQVKKGEKAIYIFAPRPYRVTTEDEQGEEQTREGLTFRSVPVFDVSQTEGDPIPTMEAPVLTWRRWQTDLRRPGRLCHPTGPDGHEPRSQDRRRRHAIDVQWVLQLQPPAHLREAGRAGADGEDVVPRTRAPSRSRAPSGPTRGVRDGG